MPKKTVCVAPDKFKGTFTAGEAAEIIAGEIERIVPGIEVRSVPLADGGEGTAEAVARAEGWSPREVVCRNALMQPAVATYYADASGQHVIIDSSAVIGLQMIPPSARDVMAASSYGLGELVRRLLDGGVGHLTIGIGGTATSDGGAGMLQALGVRFLDADGMPIDTPLTPATLNLIARVDDAAGALRRYAGRLSGLSDVAVPFLPGEGCEMSVMSFARQKGLRDDCGARLLAALTHFRESVAAVSRNVGCGAHGGAGGGLGFALESVAGCPIGDGADYVIERCGVFDVAPSLVVTGEGCLDRQSFSGKVVGTLLGECRRRAIPLAVVAGIIEMDGHPLPEGITAVEATASVRPSGPLDRVRYEARLRAAVRRLFRQ